MQDKKEKVNFIIKDFSCTLKKLEGKIWEWGRDSGGG